MLKTKLAVCFFAISFINARDVPSGNLQRQTISISVNSNILLALSKFGTEAHIPIGIVFETNKPHRLCEENRQVTERSRPISEFLDALLARSDYTWSVEDGVIVVHPTHVADQLSRVLNIKFKEFGSLKPPPITMQGSGIILANWVYGRLHPEVKGFAGSILSSPDAEQFSNFYVQNASVEQILNGIVSLGSKGMWFFRLSQDFERKKDINLHTYSYKGDANAIQTICSVGSH